MEFEKLVAERFSVRNFKKEHLKQNEIEKILQVGHLAPTGCNNQPQRILVLNNDASMEKLAKCTRCHFDAPTAMVICYNKDESWKRPYDGEVSATYDAAIVATHMMLEAYNIGVGCCWVMHFKPQALKEEFNIPENFVPAAILVMGYPAEDAKPFDGHTKFRPVEDVVFYDKF